MNRRHFALLPMVAVLWGLMSLVAGIAAAFSVAPNPLDVGKAILLPPNVASKVGSVTITNAAAPLTILSVTSDHPQFVPAQNCVKLLAAHEVCTFTVTFTPTAPGTLSATLTIASSGATRHITVDGLGKRGKLEITPDPRGFGKIYEQAPVVRTVMLLNNNPIPMALGAIGFTNPDFSETDDCAGQIPANSSCHVWVRLKASAPGLISDAAMSISDTAVGNPQQVGLDANVLALPACAAGASGTFTSTPTTMFATWRAFHTATTLQNGLVLIVGGTGNALTTHSELYNFKTCKFRLPGRDTPNSRQYHTATLLPNGNVLIAGGEVVSAHGSGASATAEIFSLAAHLGRGAFHATGSMHSAREFHTATALADGKVLIAGGTDGATVLSSAEIYDPSTGAFTPTGSMSFAREDHTATLLADSKVLIAGGIDGATTYDSAEIFNPAANHGAGKFDLLGNAMTFARGLAAAALITLGPDADDALIAGGAGTSLDTPSSADLFEPGANSLSGGFAAPGNSMSALRISPTVTPLLDGSLLIAGGTCDYAATGGQASTDLLSVNGPDAGSFGPGGTMVDGWSTTPPRCCRMDKC